MFLRGMTMAEKILAGASRRDDVAEQRQDHGGVRLINCRVLLKVSLNMLRFHQILRPNEPFHTFLLFSTINLTNCY